MISVEAVFAILAAFFWIASGILGLIFGVETWVVAVVWTSVVITVIGMPMLTLYVVRRIECRCEMKRRRENFPRAWVRR